ncbi:ParB/RepB/Spo0J family partition protein [Methylomonas fluvii]|uniref:ParB/RepB/Spo0J family partition protein n=1 Tax=Methylomonas fluvii TaxID=1854564 RepID=A0ABR9DF70_9GAMM|nr:ParB/RepB/Spo0J family partition protein [Methylomonas fluvii]MBD9361740.1 ParB/RepB/Spo0J family partition protein [Methylomonas fluvii]
MLNVDAKEILSNFDAQIALKERHRLIDVNLIDPNPEQPRTHFPEETLDRLAQSIQENGLLQPIIVQKLGDRYQLIAGERRLRAFIEMKEQKIPAIVRTVDNQNIAILALAENIVREDLTDYDIGKKIRSIEERFPNKKDLAAMIGINRTDMYRYLAFDSLPDFILNDLDTNPKLLSRSSAEQIKKMLAHYTNSDTVRSSLETAWNLLKDGKLQQTKITAYVKNKLKEVCGVNQASTENYLLDENGSEIGRVKQTGKYWAIELGVDVFDEDQRSQILRFIHGLRSDHSGSVASCDNLDDRCTP